MNILFIAHRIPYPPNKGDKIRSFHIIKHLSKNHSISLFCLADDINDLKYEGDLKKICHSVDIVPLNTVLAKIRSLFCLFSNVPLTLAYFYSGRLMRLIKNKVKKEKFDLIFIYSSSMAQYVLDIKGIPKVIDFVDMDSNKWGQYAEHSNFIAKIIYKSEEKRLRKYEKKIAGLVNHSIVTSQAEAELFKSLIPGMLISAVPNGVDYGYFKFNTEASLAAGNKKLVFVGQMDYLPNVEGIIYFCKEIFPQIKAKIPDIKLYIVGRSPTKEITRLADKNIIVTGSVEDTRPYVWEAAVCVIPLRIARGIQNKVLEAMAMGVPVVTTSTGNKGIGAKNQEEIFVNDYPAEFAESVLVLMNNPELRISLAAKARQLVENKFSWELNLKRLEEIILNV